MTYETKPIDFVTKVGDIEIPFYTFVEGPIKFSNVKIQYNPTEGLNKFKEEIYFNDQKELAMIVPDDIDALRKDMVSNALTENSKRETPRMMMNGAQYGLSGVVPNDEGTELEVMLSLKDSRFFDHMGIAQKLDTPYFENGTKTLRDYKEIDPRDFHDFLPNAVGCNVSVESSDGYFIWMNRGDLNVQYPNVKGVPAGFGNRGKDMYMDAPHPAFTAAREASEEAGSDAKPQDLTLMHVGRPFDDLHSEISWMHTSSNMKADEMLKETRPTSKYEGKLFKMEAELNDLTIKHLKNPSEWVQAHWYLTVQHLAEKFGIEKVTKKLNE